MKRRVAEINLHQVNKIIKDAQSTTEEMNGQLAGVIYKIIDL